MKPRVKRVYLNGKFLAQPLSGVQRFARELLQAMDAQLSLKPWPDVQWTLLMPLDARQVPVLRQMQVRTLPVAAGLRWEHWDLPLAARDGLLLCLGSMPVWSGPVVATLHDAAVYDRPEAFTAPYRYALRFMFRRMVARADGLATVSEFSRQRLSHWLPGAAARLSLVPNGCDHVLRLKRLPFEALRQRWPALAAGSYVLLVGNQNAVKNLGIVDAVMRACQGRSDLRFVLAGGGNAAVFAQTAVAGGLQGLGRVTDDELAALMRNAACLLFPSHYEGFGIPVVEAMALGCPVVASNIEPLRRIAGHAVILCPPDDALAMANAILKLIEQPDHRQQLIDAGRKRAAAFTWAQSAHAMLQILDPLLQARVPGSEQLASERGA